MLELDGVGFGYARQGWVFRDVTFQVLPGTATAVLGPNGSGKTTLVRCAAGLLEPAEGTVRRADGVGYVPQARGSVFGYSALDMVLMGRARQVGIFRTPGAADRAAARAAMEKVGVDRLWNRRFPTLSGGEQQLVLIARAIATGCPVLVLDEPATGLDLKNQVRVLSLLRGLLADGMALLLSTHHPDHALSLADRAVLLGRDGARTGPAGELLTDPELTALYDVPVRTLPYSDDGTPRRTIVVPYGDARDGAVGRGAI
ncbi:ABC transporter ATP-binding protein [Arthrobacter sp. UYEF3]|uniref:ABC transporter ATP-binding protein n=1 Tax=Arthrobacter sp. UYEF3 TaxID=1756365 RepID=UPI00339206B1